MWPFEKLIDGNAHQDDAGIARILRRVSQVKHVCHQRSIDPGIDASIDAWQAMNGGPPSGVELRL